MKITSSIIHENIFDYRYIYDGRLTICIIEMRNGFKFVGVSSCSDDAEYDRRIAESNAYQDAFRQIWVPMGFLLRDRLAKQENPE